MSCNLSKTKPKILHKKWTFSRFLAKFDQNKIIKNVNIGRKSCTEYPKKRLKKTDPNILIEQNHLFSFQITLNHPMSRSHGFLNKSF